MAWQIIHHPDAGFVEARCTGMITSQELFDAVTEAFAVCRRHGTMKVLADCSGMEAGHDYSDLYYLLDSIDGLDRLGDEFREAIVRPSHEGAARSVAFWETACTNRGMPVRVFGDRQKAMDWLAQFVGATV